MRSPVDSSIPRPSLVQFSIRDLLWLMVWVSVGSLAVAAVLPRLSEAQRPRLLFAVAVTLGFIATAVGSKLLGRLWLRRQAGASLWLAPCKVRTHSVVWIAWLIVGTLLSIWGIVMAVTLEGSSLFAHLLAYLSIRKAIAARWGRDDTLEFCDRGLIYQGKEFVPTERIVDCRWGAALPNRLFIQVPAGQRWEIDVDPPQHAEITRALRERVPVFRRWWEADGFPAEAEEPVSDAS